MQSTQYVFTDESGLQSSAQYCLIAGYVGSTEQWLSFDRQWQSALIDSGVAGAFHTDEFWNRDRGNRSKKRKPNQFVDWTDDQAAKLLGTLIAIIRSHGIHAVGVSVEVAAFRSLSFGERCQLVTYLPSAYRPPNWNARIVSQPEPYMLAFLGLIKATLRRAAPSAELHFRIAKHQQFQPRAIETFGLLKRVWAETNPDQERQLAGLAPSDPARTPALQAADLLAYFWGRVMKRGGDPGRLRPIERLVWRSITSRDSELHVIDLAAMIRMLDLAAPDGRAYWRSIQEPK